MSEYHAMRVFLDNINKLMESAKSQNGFKLIYAYKQNIKNLIKHHKMLISYFNIVLKNMENPTHCFYDNAHFIENLIEKIDKIVEDQMRIVNELKIELALCANPRAPFDTLITIEFGIIKFEFDLIKVIYKLHCALHNKNELDLKNTISELILLWENYNQNIVENINSGTQKIIEVLAALHSNADVILIRHLIESMMKRAEFILNILDEDHKTKN